MIQKILAQELIGLSTEIVSSKDPSLSNIHGKIVYETKHLLFMSVDHSMKKIPKNIVQLSLKLHDGDYLVNGSELIGRPEDRIQRLR